MQPVVNPPGYLALHLIRSRVYGQVLMLNHLKFGNAYHKQ